jgi:hypothetical protein
MVNDNPAPTGQRTSTRFQLTIDGRTYDVQIVRPGVISVDGHLFNVERLANGVKVDEEPFVASICTDFAIVGGKLYETEWKVES